MCHPTKEASVVSAATEQFKDRIVGFIVEEWLSRPGNLALTNANGDVSLFERQYRQPNTVCGHYFFHSRGKEAREAAVDMLAEAFTGPYGIEVILGLTPTDHKGALAMNRYLGLTEYDIIETETGPCQFVMITRHDWENNQ